MSHFLNVLAELTLDAWLLARACVDPARSLVDGRAWERGIGDLLWRPGFAHRQGPGTTTLFGLPAASGAAHELDAGAVGQGGSVIVECKSQGHGVTKADAAVFHEKTLDFYCGRPDVLGRERWWRLMVSSSPVTDGVRAFCVQLGVILCDPVRLPLPVVVRTGCHRSADLYFRETLLQEAVRLGEPALMPMQKRWTYDTTTGDIRFRPQVLGASEIEDLLWLQDELGADILDLYDLRYEGLLEKRQRALMDRFRKSA